MTRTAPTDTADLELKSRHRAMWALGDYPAVAAEVVADLGPTLVRACEIGPGDRVLDVAAGSGNAAIPAAETGAHVVASDLTPELLAVGERDANARGVSIEWREADAEALPFTDGEFDVVVSCLGAMFAPHHQRTADELLRVCRPGGTIGLIAWTPEGFIGQMFATMKAYVPAPPPGVEPPPLWGRDAHVRALFGERVTEVTAAHAVLDVDHFATPESFRDYFKTNYGPTIAAYRAVAADPEKTRALDADLCALAEAHLTDGHMPWEYLLLTAKRR